MPSTSDLLEFIDNARKYGFIRIVSSTDLDSLLASGVLLKTLVDNGVSAVLNLDPKVVLDEKDEPTLVINLPLTIERKNVFNMVFDENSSTTALVVHTLDKVFKISKWAKTVALVAGVYRWLDVGKEGFRGLEKYLLEELVSSNHVIREIGFKLPGWRKISLAKSIYRSLLPYLPGYSGRWDNVVNLVRNVFGNVDVEKVLGSEVFDRKDSAAINELLRKIDRSLEYLGEDIRKKIMYRLVGYVYHIDFNGVITDFIEIINALSLVLSIDRRNPIYIAMIGFNKEFLAETLYIYGELIEDRVQLVSEAIENYVSGKTRIIGFEKGFERPELIIDILYFLNKIPSDKVLCINIGGELLTNVSILLKQGFKQEEVFTFCDENQICRVRGSGEGLLKA
ncbi:MAG: hypothetical protein QXM54_02660 [Desulfurococcaceae archaeon]